MSQPIPERRAKAEDSSTLSQDLPTPRTLLAADYVRVLVWCRACHHEADAARRQERRRGEQEPVFTVER